MFKYLIIIFNLDFGYMKVVNNYNLKPLWQNYLLRTKSNVDLSTKKA